MGTAPLTPASRGLTFLAAQLSAQPLQAEETSTLKIQKIFTNGTKQVGFIVSTCTSSQIIHTIDWDSCPKELRRAIKKSKGCLSVTLERTPSPTAEEGGAIREEVRENPEAHLPSYDFEKALQMCCPQSAARQFTLEKVGGPRKLFLSEIYHQLDKELEKSHPGGNRAFIIACRYFILPFQSCWNFLKQKSVDKRASEELKTIVAGRDPKNIREWRDFLSRYGELLKKDGWEEEGALFRKAAKNSREQESFDFTKIQSQLAANGECAIASGCTMNGKFTPLIYFIKKDENNSYLLTLWGAGEPPIEQTWNLGKEDSSLKIALKKLLSYSLSTPERSTTTRNMEALLAMTPPGNATSPTRQTPLLNRDVYQVIEEELKNINATKVSSTQIGPQRGTTRRGIESLLLKALPSAQDKSAVKVLFTVCQIQRELFRLKKVRKELRPEEVRALIAHWEQELIRVRARLPKIDQDNHTACLEAINFLDKELCEIKKEALSSKQRVESSPFLEPVLSKKKSSPPLRATPPLLLQELTALNLTLPSGLTSPDDCDRAGLATFSKGVAEVDRLIAAKNYKEALELAALLHQKLPLPSIDDTDYWSYRKTGTPQAKEALKQWHKEWSLQIDTLTKCCWEAHLQQGNSLCQPAEVLELLKTRAIIVKILRIEAYISFSEPAAASKTKYMDGNDLLRDSRLAVDAQPERKLRYSSAERSLLLFQYFQTDANQLLDVLASHPVYALNDPQLLKDFNSLSIFFSSNENHYSGGSKTNEWKIVLRLDSDADTQPDTTLHAYAATKAADDMFIFALAGVFIDNPSALTKAEEDSFNETKDRLYSDKEMDPKKAELLAPELVCLRRHLAFTQMMLHPNTSAALSFGSEMIAGVKQLSWWQGIQETARNNMLSQGISNPERIQKECLRLVYADLDKQFKGLQGRLTLKTCNYSGQYLSNTLSICGEKGDPLIYLPFGLNLDEQLRRQLESPPNDWRQVEELIPLVPLEWLQSITGVTRDGELCSYTEEQRSNREKQRAVQFRPGLTEPTILQQSRFDEREDLDSNQIFLLRTLCVKSSRSKYPPNNSLFIELLALFGNHPGIVDNPAAQQLIDFLLATVPPTPSAGSADSLENVKTTYSNARAALLTKLTALISNNECKNAAILLHNYSQLCKTLGLNEQNFINWNTTITINETERSLLSILQEKAPQEPWVQLLTLEHLQHQWNQEVAAARVERRAPNLPRDLCVELLETRNRLAALSSSEVAPLLLQSFERWYASEFFPFAISQRSTANHLFSKIQNDGAPAINSVSQDFTQPHLWQVNTPDGVYKVDLREVRVSKGNEIIYPSSTEVMLPSEVYKGFPILKKIAPKSITLTMDPKTGLEQYSFCSDTKDKFLLKRNPKTEECHLFLVKSVNNKETLWEYRKVSAQQADSTVGRLAERYGFWLSTTNSKRGLIQLPEDLQLEGNEIFCTLSKDGTLLETTSASGDLLFFDLDTKKELLVDPRGFPSLYRKKSKPDRWFSRGVTAPKDELCFLGDPLKLQRSTQGGWVLVAGNSPVVAANGSLGQAEVIPTQRWHLWKNALGKEDGFFVENGQGGATLYLWPKFNDSSSDLSSSKAIQISIDAQGKISGSCGHLLALALVLAKRKEYSLAEKLVLQAKASAQITQEADRKLFNEVKMAIDQWEPTGARAINWFLVTMLAVEDIDIQQLGQHEYSPLRDSAYLKKQKRFLSLFKQLENHSARSGVVLPGLIDEQINAKERLAQEALLIKMVNSGQRVPEDGAASFLTLKNSIEAVDPTKVGTEFCTQLGVHLTDASFTNWENSAFAKQWFGKKDPINPGDLLENFFALYSAGNNVNKERLWSCPIIGEFSAITPEEKALIEAAKLARRLILQPYHAIPNKTALVPLIKEIKEAKEQATAHTPIKGIWNNIKNLLSSEDVENFIDAITNQPLRDYLDKIEKSLVKIKDNPYKQGVPASENNHRLFFTKPAKQSDAKYMDSILKTDFINFIRDNTTLLSLSITADKITFMENNLPENFTENDFITICGIKISSSDIDAIIKFAFIKPSGVIIQTEDMLKAINDFSKNQKQEYNNRNAGKQTRIINILELKPNYDLSLLPDLFRDAQAKLYDPDTFGVSPQKPVARNFP